MRPGSVLVDVAIDQGGCAATSRTSTLALTQATLPYLLALANQGVKQAMLNDPGLRSGLNTCAGKVTHAHLAEDFGMEYWDADRALAGV